MWGSKCGARLKQLGLGSAQTASDSGANIAPPSEDDDFAYGLGERRGLMLLKKITAL